MKKVIMKKFKNIINVYIFITFGIGLEFQNFGIEGFLKKPKLVSNIMFEQLLVD